MCEISQISNISSEGLSYFNEEYNSPELSPFLRNTLQKCINSIKPKVVEIMEIVKKSKEFPIKFPINSCRVEFQPRERYDHITIQANSVRPVLHERAVWLYLNFLEYKSKYGDLAEKKFYENIGICEFIQRLLEKRCVCFYDSSDSYTLLNGKRGMELYNEPVPLESCLTYEEVKLSALLSVSSYTEFINDGNRYNCGHIEENKSRIEENGFIIGLIGARFERPEEMEYQDIVIEQKQNQKENGYGYSSLYQKSSVDWLEFPFALQSKIEYRKLWNGFYNENDFEYSKALNVFTSGIENRIIKESKHSSELFDKLIMKKRFAISFDTLLLEAESRATADGKQAYIHVVGIGLGVWKFCNEQDKIFLETFGDRIETLKNQLNHIGFIDFSWFKLQQCKGIKTGGKYEIENHPNGGIQLFFSERNPHTKLNPEKFQNCLLVVSYAWDGNALPGNEFWDGALSASGDPAAACSTLISELHNPHINTKRCNGNNLHVATSKHGVIHISEYAKKILNID